MKRPCDVKKYAFVWSNQTHCLGGVQTLMARMSQCLVRRGREVEVVFLGLEPPRAVLDLFAPEVVVSFVPSDQIAPWRSLLGNRSAWKSADVAIAFDDTAVFYALSSTRAGGPVVLPYVVGPGQYHPQKVFMRLREPPGRRRFRREIDVSLICFMTDELRRAHEAATGDSMSGSRVIPLPVDTERFAAIERAPQRFEIVSVGRIDPILKPYNTSCIAAIKELHDEGVPIVWKIFGGDNTGARSATFERHLQSLGVTDVVQYMGEIGYDDFPKVLRSAYAFIGMGTAVIEAAAAGVPCVVAIAGEHRPVTQGLLSDLPAGSCGEVQEGWSVTPVKDHLKRLMALNAAQYEDLCRREAECAARNFGVNARMDEFEAMAAAAMQRFGAKDRGLAWPRSLMIRLTDFLDYRLWLAGNRVIPALKRAVNKA